MTTKMGTGSKRLNKLEENHRLEIGASAKGVQT
jgi:hypothetical protein